jgi:hypothetical protein
VEHWNNGMMGLNPIIPTIQQSNIPLFRAAGRTATGGTGPAGRAGSTFKLPTTGKGKSRHYPLDFLTFAFGAGDLLRSIVNQFFKFLVALIAMILINWHFTLLL